jgi:hypothetical protein
METDTKDKLKEPKTQTRKAITKIKAQEAEERAKNEK